MTDLSGWTAVREEDLAAAGAVVVRFRRRRRRVVAGAAAGLGVAAVMSSSALLPASTSSLVPADRGRVPTPRPVPSASPAAALPPRAGAPATGAPAPGGGGPDASVRPSPPGAGPAAPPAGPRDPRPGAARAAMRTRTFEGVTCAGTAVFVTPRLCRVSSSAVHADGTYTLVFQACYAAPPGVWPAEVEFATTREVDFALRSPSGRVVWQWSTGQRFPASRHTITLAPNECYEWRTTWDGLLDDGTKPAPGTYRLRGAGRDETNQLRHFDSDLTVR
jgi:hypothetical protein